MGSLGFPEIAFILVLALLIFGPKKLPEIGRTLGKGVAEFRRATDELKRSINTELALDETPVPPVLRTRRLEDPAEPVQVQPVQAQPVQPLQEAQLAEPAPPAYTVAAPPGEAPPLTEPRPLHVVQVATVAAVAEPLPAVAPAPEAVTVPAAPEASAPAAAAPAPADPSAPR
jgi:sec-independent protein translocase protein TatA